MLCTREWRGDRVLFLKEFTVAKKNKHMTDQCAVE
jgi:hypothetical protein